MEGSAPRLVFCSTLATPSSPERRPRPKQRRHAPSPVPRRSAAVVAVAYLRRPPAPASFPASLVPRRPDPATVRLLSVLVLLRPATATTNSGHQLLRRPRASDEHRFPCHYSNSGEIRFGSGNPRG